MHGNPAGTTSTLTYSLRQQPAHGTISNFNPSTGTLTYTPDSRVSPAPITLTYQTTATARAETPATTVSNPATVTFGVGAEDTGTVNVVGWRSDVSPVPHAIMATNTIDVSQVPTRPRQQASATW